MKYKKRNAYKWNHFIPQFLIKRWAENDKFFLALRKDCSIAQLASKNANSIFAGPELYWARSLYPENPSYFETNFFAPIDTKFSKIVKKIDECHIGKIDFLSSEELKFVIDYCLMLFFRTPNQIKKLSSKLKSDSFPDAKDFLIDGLSKTFDKKSLFSTFLLNKELYILKSKHDFILSEFLGFWTGINLACEPALIFPISYSTALVYGLPVRRSNGIYLNNDDVIFYNTSAMESAQIAVTREKSQVEKIVTLWKEIKQLESKGYKKSEFGYVMP